MLVQSFEFWLKRLGKEKGGFEINRGEGAAILGGPTISNRELLGMHTINYYIFVRMLKSANYFLHRN